MVRAVIQRKEYCVVMDWLERIVIQGMKYRGVMEWLKLRVH